MILKAAELRKQSIDVQYDAIKNILYNEALLAKFCGLQFNLAKQIRLSPGSLDDTFALAIKRVLAQLDTLLTYCELPSIHLLVPESLINIGEGGEESGLYAGYPTPLAIREMQRGRETITIYTYLFMAEIGLFTILAHRTPYEKFSKFRSIDKKYSDEFVEVLKPIEIPASYETSDRLFDWVEYEQDKAMCRQIFGNIIAALKVVDLLRKAAAKSA